MYFKNNKLGGNTMNRILYTLSLFLVIILFISCGGGGSGSGSSVNSGSEVSFRDKGDFLLGQFSTKYTENNWYKGSIYIKDINVLKGYFQNIAKELNSDLALNKNVIINAVDCGTINAFYDPTNSNITMCNELLLDMTLYLMTYYNLDLNTAGSYAILGYLAAFGHELGHALIDNYDLPVLGKEEDAADAMAVVLLIESSETAEERRLAATGIIVLADYLTFAGSFIPWYDSHSLALSRLANFICWAGGAEPSILQGMIADIYNAMISLGRDCQAEYANQYDAVIDLLFPYIKRDFL